MSNKYHVNNEREFFEHILPQFQRPDWLGISVEWISCNLIPEDVFDDTVLAEWAQNNGFIRKEGSP